MIKIISLYDGEEDSTLEISIDSDCSGVMLYGKNQYDEKIVMDLDSRLFKKLCNEVSKHIGYRAQKTNECGSVENDTV